ncbi:putative outer membrane protein [Pedobacter sp. BAL39]|uniref:SusC/RagA family TonB-linked outer membrane protein n=1 Tax=Pedobacter sp. BAL39 TaxID=391596 RepID=UPI0001559934|nr:SusC/RagA family TonB-linked outer membrane protein [Pedobacter sp. BAL39]EDM36240.1 putative outer membrane protein [Pedobacter sp. BAL39]
MYKFYTNNPAVPKGYAAKILLIMRLTTVLLLFTFMQVSAASYGQRISLKGRDLSLEQVFNAIRQQSGYDFVVKENLLLNAKPVSLNIHDATIQDALSACLKNQPFTYVLIEKTIVIKKKEPSILEKVSAIFAKIEVRGRIVDANGRPLAGANIAVVGGSKNTITSTNGTFYLGGVNEKAEIEISYVGYLTRRVVVRAELGDLILELIESKLNEVQVIAYGNEEKRFSVGSVASVNASEIEKQPVTNPLLALQGRIAGLAVNGSNGVPGSTALVQVRGQNTLGTTLQVKPYDQPLFIIDGVPFAQQNVNINQLNSLATAQSFTGGISQATGISPFNSINPNDIESITILKDAAATSIYGSQGANGVVLITTKRGKSGQTTLDVNLNTQFNFVARPVEMLNTQQYLQLRREAFAADELTPSGNPEDYSNYAPDLTLFDQNKYTNWQKLIRGRTTNNTDFHATVSGGTAASTYLVAAGYTRSNYNYPGDFSNQRFTLHSALHSASANNRFTLDLVTDYGYDQNNSAAYGGNQSVVLAPNLPDLKDASGNLIWNYKGYSLDGQNFYAGLLRRVYLQNYNFNTALNLSYKVLTGLTIGANIGYNRSSTEERSENPASSQEPTYAEPSAAFGDNVAQTINVEPQLNYTLPLGKGVLTALLGATYKKVTSDAYRVEGYGYSSDYFLRTIIGATTTYPSQTLDMLRYNAGFARLKYVHDEKYIVEVSGRRDGSSNFGPGRQFGNFASVGAGWIFSEESLFDSFPTLTYGKLSGSYGTSGGDASRAYSYQALYQNLSGVPAFQDIKQAYAYNLYNPDFSWATKKALNLSLDLGFIDNRVVLNATYYRNREGNQLVDMPLAAQSGFTRVFGNLDAVVQNKGWEFTATTTNVKGRDFTWSTTFNLTLNRNKLLEFPNLESSAYANKYIIGQPVSTIIGYRYKGVNPTTGLYEFYDRNGEVTSSPRSGRVANGGDEVPLGDMEVKYMGGFGNNFTYGNFGLYVFCQFSSSNAPNYLAALYNTDFPGSIANQPAEILGKYWKNPNDQATIQRLGSSFYSGSLSTIPPFTRSDGVYSDNTYLRVKTVALSYALPGNFLQKIHVRSGSIYMNAQNLFTITNYKAGDPEQPGTFTAFPLQRIVAFGLNFKF